jgi:hypothetical protein
VLEDGQTYKRIHLNVPTYRHVLLKWFKGEREAHGTKDIIIYTYNIGINMEVMTLIVIAYTIDDGYRALSVSSETKELHTDNKTKDTKDSYI